MMMGFKGVVKETVWIGKIESRNDAQIKRQLREIRNGFFNYVCLT